MSANSGPTSYQGGRDGKASLLVEDDLDLSDVLQYILESEGYDVIPAADGHQALEYLRASRRSDDAPAVLILDLMVPS